MRELVARLDALLHDAIHSVLACGNPRFQGLPGVMTVQVLFQFTSGAWA